MSKGEEVTNLDILEQFLKGLREDVDSRLTKLIDRLDSAEVRNNEIMIGFLFLVGLLLGMVFSKDHD